MALSKTARTLQSSASNAAAGTTTGTALDLTSKYGGLATLKVANGATGPTVACSARLEVSHDNSTWKTFFQATAAAGNSAVTEWAIEIPPSVMYLRSVFSGNTGQAVTVEALFSELTSL